MNDNQAVSGTVFGLSSFRRRDNSLPLPLIVVIHARYALGFTVEGARIIKLHPTVTFAFFHF